MAIKTYRAKSPSEALSLVKKDIGPDAVILHTRTYKTGGLMGIGARSITEITATSGSQAGATPAPRAGAKPPRQRTVSAPPAQDERPARGSDGDALELSSGALRRAREAVRNGRDPESHTSTPSTVVLEPDPEPVSRARPSRIEVSALEPAPVKVNEQARPSGETAVASELAELKKMMGQVLRSARSGRTGTLPEALEDIARALDDAEMDSEIVDQVIGGVLEELTPDELRTPEVVRQVAQRRLATLVPVDGSVAKGTRTESGGPMVIALVGPTGVGKTTTIAKLAATFKLRHGRNVGLITSDTYRIAAVDQLRTYANIIGLPIKVTLTPAEMSQAVRAYDDRDVVLVDTAGRSPKDVGRIDELRTFLEAARPQATQVVLSATSGARVIRTIVEVFGALAPTHTIATKLDECAALGPVLGAVRAMGAPLSYVTTGQEVPDQIETACADRFARRLIAGNLVGGAS